MKDVVALITARGGSKSIPRKNLVNLAGAPLISYTFDAALSSKYINRIFLSSEDEEILNVGKRAGVEVIVRPAELATDTATSVSVVAHMLKHIEWNETTTCILLQPTSPLRKSGHIDEALELFWGRGADTLVSITETEHHPFKSFSIDDSGISPLKGFEYFGQPRQDLPRFYRVNGAIYIFRPKTFLQNRAFVMQNSVPFVMGAEHSVDIDTCHDLRYAEFLSTKGDQ